MARILYGVAGQGFGHSTRSELLGKQLIKSGHDVLFAASMQSYEYLKSNFGNVKKIHGLSFFYSEGKIKLGRTLFKNIKDLKNNIIITSKFFKKDVKNFNPDIVISDFEPFVSWWADFNHIPHFCIDHEHFITCLNFDKNKYIQEKIIAKLVTLINHSSVDKYIIINFFKTTIKNKKAILVPPVVRSILENYIPEKKDYILIYSTDNTKKQCQKIINLTKRCNHYFIIYGFDINVAKNNYIFKKTKTEDFIYDLSRCKFVLSTAGFSLLSECLYFKKPMFLMPLTQQYEQILNAIYVDKLKLGTYSFDITPDKINLFNNHLDDYYKENNDIIFPNNKEYFKIINNEFNKYNISLVY